MAMRREVHPCVGDGSGRRGRVGGQREGGVIDEMQ
jgi:hypothetical protein